MENTLLLLLSVFPSLVLGYIIYRQDKIEKEPFYLLIRLLVGGVLAVVAIVICGVALGLSKKKKEVKEDK